MRKYAVAIALALIVAIVAPFVASSNPDGLESTAEHFEVEEGYGLETPFADYGIDGMGKMGEITSLVLGTFIVLFVGYCSSIVIKRT